MDSPSSFVSVYRSFALEISVFSSAVELTDRTNSNMTGTLPVFADRDQISGQVFLSPSCSSVGKLTITLEGSFSHTRPESGAYDHSKNKSVFLSTSVSFPEPSKSDPGSPRSSIRKGISKMRRRLTNGSSASLPSGTCPFTFELPAAHQDETLPASYSSSPGRYCASQTPGEKYEISYKILVTWEPSVDIENRTMLDVPIRYQPDVESRLVERALAPCPWQELPLAYDRLLAFRSAVTLPNPSTFRRGDMLPFFIVFATTPPSVNLAREIASDATISVALIREVTVQKPVEFPLTPPLTPTSLSDDSDSLSSARTNFLRRVAKSSSSIRSRARSNTSGSTTSACSSEAGFILNKVSHLSKNDTTIRAKDFAPSMVASHSGDSRNCAEERMLQSIISVGFPSRPRKKSVTDATDSFSHPPDGLFRSSMDLDESLIPSINWGGISVKYFVDVSIAFDQDDFRARYPITIL